MLFHLLLLVLITRRVCFWCTNMSQEEDWRVTCVGGRKAGRVVQHSLGLWGTRLPLGLQKLWLICIMETERCVFIETLSPLTFFFLLRRLLRCDLGLATWTWTFLVPFLCKTVKGTFGYLALEYFQRGKVSDKTNDYAFEVVLLELISGWKPIETKRSPREENLVLWDLIYRRVKELLKSCLILKWSASLRLSNQIGGMIEAATACVTNEESRRPGIHEIIAILKGEEDLFSLKENSWFLWEC